MKIHKKLTHESRKAIATKGYPIVNYIPLALTSSYSIPLFPHIQQECTQKNLQLPPEEIKLSVTTHL